MLAVLDCTVWPSNNVYLHNCIQMFNTVLSLSGRNAGLVMMPVVHAQTTQNALLKHTRIILDALNAAGLDITNNVALLFDKQGSLSHDKRKTLQNCLLVTTTAGQEQNAWLNSTAWANQCIGPVPLIKVSDMIGYDADSPPGASARVSQTPGA